METLFVSSTFRDLLFERDAIRDIVLPRLNEEAQKYGQSVAVCDLRWGINTQDLDSETANRRVLDICLDEIAQSASPMIVILGERYGWIPPVELIRSAAERNRLRLNDLSLSVTALEIEYGMSIHRENTLFYFRELQNAPADEKYLPEDSEHQKKLQALKAKIVRQAGDRVRTFRVRFDGADVCQEDVRQFVNMVYEDVCRAMKPRWSRHRQGTPEEQEQEQERHWTYFRERNQLFLARLEQANQIVQKVLDGMHSVSIKGSPGSGKSTLLGKIAVILSEYNMTVIPIACGLTETASTAMGVLRLIVTGMELELKLPHKIEKANGDVNLWRARQNELCAMFDRRGQKLVVMVDAVDQLAQNEDRDNMIFLPDSRQAQVIVSSLPHIAYQGEQDIPLLPIGDAEKKAVIRRMLEYHHRDLADQVISELTEKGSSDAPLYLSLILQRLMMMSQTEFDQINRRGGGMEEISHYQIDMIRDAPESLEGMSAALMRTAGDKINGELVSRVNEYIAVSRYGLRESDLALLLGDKWDYLAFRQMLNYMRESYMRRDDGRYDFTHQSIRRGIQRACKDQAHRHHEIWAALHKLADPVRIGELIYHCMKATKVNNQKYFVSHVAHFYKDDLVLKGAAGCVYAVSMIDGGKWMSELFEKAEEYGQEKWLIQFFDGYCRNLFSENYTESVITLQILRQESELLDRLVVAGNENLAEKWMWCYEACSVAAKNAYDDSRMNYVEKYYAVGKKLYQKGILDDQAMWDVYYNVVNTLKDTPDESGQRRGAEIAKVAMDSGLMGKLLDQGVDLGAALYFFGSLGEIYMRLGEYDKCLDAYQRDLKLRRGNAEKRPTATNHFFAAGGYYNVGNALVGLGRFEEACFYYETAVELTEKYHEAGETNVWRLMVLQSDFNLYDNYAIALGAIEPKTGVCNIEQYKKAFAYKKKAIRLYRCYHQENQTFPERFPKLAKALGGIISNLYADKSCQEMCRSEMYQLFNDILTEDEGRLILSDTIENMNILGGDYLGIFRALEYSYAPEEVQKEYRDRFRGSIIQHFDNKIRKAEKEQSTGQKRKDNIALAYYNKSLAFFQTEQRVFFGEAVELAEKASQMYLEMESPEGIESKIFWTTEAAVFYYTGKCFAQVEDIEAVAYWYKAAADRQRKALELSGDSDDAKWLKEFESAYDAVKNLPGYVSLDRLMPLKKAFTAEKPKQQSPAPKQPKSQKLKTVQNANGTQTATYSDGSRYTGQWKDGQREGFGEIVFPSGAGYRGEWKADKMCGYGVRIDIYGKEIYGLWDGNTLIKSVSKIRATWALRKYKR